MHVVLGKPSQILGHNHDADIKEMHPAEGQRAALLELLLVVVEVLRNLHPMQSSIQVVDDVVPIVERGLVDRRVDAIVSQGVVVVAVLRVHENVLCPVAEGHGRHGDDVRDAEDPECGAKVDVLRQENDAAEPDAETSKNSLSPPVLAGADGVGRELDPNEHRKVQPIAEEVKPRVPLVHLGAGGVQLVVVLNVVHDHVVQLVNAARDAEEGGDHPADGQVQGLAVEEVSVRGEVDAEREALLEEENQADDVGQAGQVPDQHGQRRLVEIHTIDNQHTRHHNLDDVQQQAEHREVALVPEQRRQAIHEERRPEVVLIPGRREVRIYHLVEDLHLFLAGVGGGNGILAHVCLQRPTCAPDCPGTHGALRDQHFLVSHSRTT
mmetsp:Transcript_35957/g.116385  ORF Transcript_35957/g.116385 Transcript_35957/m.116385 type:complete len:380 (-) Transcript_35957:18-1157(-)